MQPVKLYTKSTCGFCHAAKRLLASKGVSFSEIDILDHPEKRKDMVQESGGGQTVPQIFIGDIHVGGYDDISMLERTGKLDQLLSMQ